MIWLLYIGYITHLYSILRKLCFDAERFAGVNIRIMSLIESVLQLFDLIACENSPAAAVVVCVDYEHWGK